MVTSDLMVYLTPITFGGYSSVLKKMIDHQLPNVSPLFAQVHGETRHQPRYPNYPDFLAIGWLEQHELQTETIFRHLAHRNAINFYAKKSMAEVVTGNQTDREIQRFVQKWLNELKHSPTVKLETSLPIAETHEQPRPIRSALLLVGSPRTRKSTSHALGSYLFQQLNPHNIETKTIHIHTSIHSPERMKSLLEAVDAADLVLLAFPLYIDSLPAPTIEALERIAAHRAANVEMDQYSTQQPLFAAISNCGFPEARHNETALAICANFARKAGFNWAGSLALGAGEGMIHGTPLNELDGRVNSLKKALDFAAEALAQGHPFQQKPKSYWQSPSFPVGCIAGWESMAGGSKPDNMAWKTN